MRRFRVSKISLRNMLKKIFIADICYISLVIPKSLFFVHIRQLYLTVPNIYNMLLVLTVNR